MRAITGSLLIVTAIALTACDAPRTYELPPPPPLAEPTAHMPGPLPSPPQPMVTPPQKAPSWTLMPSQRTGCGRAFC